MNTTNITELIPYVNSQLQEGLSIVKVEKKLGFGKDTLRRKIVREGYIFNRDIHQFVIDTNNVTQETTHNITHTKPSNLNPNKSITHCITHKTSTQRALTNEDFEILFKIIDLYKDKQNKQSNLNQDLEGKKIMLDRENEEITTRSFRSYKKIFKLFSEYCLSNKLNQKDALADALISFMSE